MKLGQEEINTYKKKAKLIKTYPGESISAALKKLVKYREEGEFGYYVEIYGQKVYSVDIDFDAAFKKIVGASLEELEKKIEEAEEREKINMERKAEDAVINLQKRIESGTKETITAKQPIWKEFVLKHSQPPYYTDAIDTIIKYLRLLNSNKDINIIGDMFLQEFPETGDWYTSATLTYIAQFSQRGIELFEHLIKIKKPNKVDESATLYFNKLKNINNLIANGMDYKQAYDIAEKRLAIVNLSSFKYPVIMDPTGFFKGYKDDYMILGRVIGNQSIIYMLDGINYNSYLTVDDKTLEVYIDGTLSDGNEDYINFEYQGHDIGQLVKLYDEVMRRLEEQDQRALNEVISQINLLTTCEGDISDLVLKDAFKVYKKEIQELKKKH